MKEKNEIIDILTNDYVGEKCIGKMCMYCGGEIMRGYYAEDGIGRKLTFPKYLTEPFTNEPHEVIIHYKCVEPFVLDMIREGGGSLGATRDNTRILIRY